MSPRNLAIAAVVLFAMLLVEVWPFSKTTRVLAFAEVQGQIETTKSVQYTETRQDMSHDGKSVAPKTETRTMILGRYLERDELKVLTSGDKLEGGAKWLPHPDHSISIFDAKAGKDILLLPESKRFSKVKGTGSFSPDNGKITFEKITPMPEVDFYKQIRDLLSGKAEKLPDRTIDGKRTLGYRFVEKQEEKFGKKSFTNTSTRDIWVDPGTKLPVRIEGRFRSDHPMIGATDYVMSDFIWDAPLDPSLFSTNPPEGYKEMK
jgi:hypothetical protein